MQRGQAQSNCTLVSKVLGRVPPSALRPVEECEGAGQPPIAAAPECRLEPRRAEHAELAPHRSAGAPQRTGLRETRRRHLAYDPALALWSGHVKTSAPFSQDEVHYASWRQPPGLVQKTTREPAHREEVRNDAPHSTRVVAGAPVRRRRGQPRSDVYKPAKGRVHE